MDPRLGLSPPLSSSSSSSLAAVGGGGNTTTTTTTTTCGSENINTKKRKEEADIPSNGEKDQERLSPLLPPPPPPATTAAATAAAPVNNGNDDDDDAAGMVENDDNSSCGNENNKKNKRKVADDILFYLNFTIYFIILYFILLYKFIIHDDDGEKDRERLSFPPPPASAAAAAADNNNNKNGNDDDDPGEEEEDKNSLSLAIIMSGTVGETNAGETNAGETNTGRIIHNEEEVNKLPLTEPPPCATIGSGSLMSRKVLKSSPSPSSSSSSPSSSSSSTATTTILNAGALLSIIKFFTEAMLDYKLKGKSIPLLDILDTIKLKNSVYISKYDESRFLHFDPIDKESEILVTSFLLLEIYPLCSTTTTNNNNNQKKTSDDSNDDDDDDHIVEETISDLNLDINAYVAYDRDMRTSMCNHYAARAGSALYRAIELGHYDVATYLVEMGANLNQERYTGFSSSAGGISYLHDVCHSKGTVRKGNFERRREFVKYLIQDKNASFLLEEKLCNGSTPLQYAVSYKAAGQQHDIHLVRMFLDHLTTPGHVHCNIADHVGKTALHLLCRCPKKTDFHFEAARLLVEHGGNIEQKTHAGDTPLATMAWNLQEDDEKMHFDFIKMMINELGANPNCIPSEFMDGMNPKGKTLLHFACQSFNFVQLLLENGADPDIADNDGDRPVDYAKQDGYNDIVALLQRFSDTAE